MPLMTKEKRKMASLSPLGCLLCLMFLSSSLAQSCTNPAFINPQMYGASSSSGVGSIKQKSSGSTASKRCKYYDGKSKTCCNDDTLSAIGNSIDSMKTTYSKFGQAFSTLSRALPTISQQICSAIASTVSQMPQPSACFLSVLQATPACASMLSTPNPGLPAMCSCLSGLQSQPAPSCTLTSSDMGLISGVRSACSASATGVIAKRRRVRA